MYIYIYINTNINICMYLYLPFKVLWVTVIPGSMLAWLYTARRFNLHTLFGCNFFNVNKTLVLVSGKMKVCAHVLFPMYFTPPMIVHKKVTK